MLWVRACLAGWAAGVLRVHVDVWVALGGLGWVGERWGLGCRGCLWRGALVVQPAGLLGCSGGVLEACGRRRVCVCWARSRLVDFWVMQGMVMDEMHVFPGAGVDELFRVCQQEVFAVYHLGRCSAECF